MNDEPQVRPQTARRLWIGRILALAALVAAVLGAAALLLDTPAGHRFVTAQIAKQRPSNGLRYTVGRIDGSLYGKATLIDVRISDPRGLVLATSRAELDWRPFAWIGNVLDIRSLVIPQATLAKLPETIKTGRKSPILPSFDIAIGELRVDRLDVAPAITGVARTGTLRGSADVRSGRARVMLAAAVQGSDALRLRLDAAPDDNKFDFDVSARGQAGGVLAKLTGIARPLAAEVHGDGDWRAWRGTAVASAGDARIADLRLSNDAGRYALAGSIAPGSLLRGKLQRISVPRILVDGAATLANRRLGGTLSLRSPAISLDTSGEIDLAARAYRNVRITGRLLRPSALFPNMSGRNIQLRAILDGAFDTAAVDYRLTADRVQFDATGFDTVRAAGRLRLSDPPVIVPVALTAARVTGVGDVAGGILRNLRVTGPLRVTADELTGDGLRLSSDKLNGRITLFLDLGTGRYEVGLTGGLQRYLIPGVGLVDVQSRLSVTPGPGGKGTRVIGRGSANVVRLDNAFFAGLTRGLPRITTGLERGNDGILYLRGLVLTSPGLTLRGNGYRRRDGTFFLEGVGTQAQYGPLTLRLNGRIDRPTIDLVLRSPNATLGLRDVRAHLDPTAEGFAFTAAGRSRLGAFTGTGAILLPRGGAARIQVARLDVAGTRSTGALNVVAGGFDGQLEVAGSGLSGALTFAPRGSLQHIDILLDARAAQLPQGLRIRRGHLEASVLLDPAGTTIDATVTAQGLRRGALSLGRLSASAKLVNGMGEVRAAIAGNRGRAFAIQSVIQVAADRYAIQAQGTVDRRPIALQNAVLTRDPGSGSGAGGDGWRLQSARLSFAGGEAQIGGRFSAAETAVDVSVARMPLSVLDIGYPGLGLGGSATGTLHYADRAGAAPTGAIAMTVRGLSRSGLVLSSRPIDVGVSGVLSADTAALRAIMASGGQTIGRAQMRLAPLGGGDLIARLANARLFGQLRYAGPADTLWRLTGVELFDLSGPVAIGADVTGSLADPQIRGSLRTQTARIESGVTGTVLRNVAAQGRFGGSRLVIDRFTAQDAGAGRVSGSGTFDLAAARGFGIDLNVQADNIQLIGRDDIAATVTGPLRFRSDGSGGVISGQVRVNKGRYRLGRAAQTVPVPRLNIREINVPGGDEDDDTPADPWRLDLDARISDGFVVQGLGLDSLWSGNLKIAGEPTNPRISGRLNLVRGDYEFAGREFDIERGVIGFDGSVPANPSLDIAANANTQGLTATIRVTGTADRPEIGFTSIPALPEDELLSRLLFGTSITTLSAPEALQLASAVAALNSGAGLDPINAVRRAAGLDRLRILPADPQTGAGTAIAAGKYLTRRVYAEIISDGQGYSATRVEFQVTRWLSLLSSISTIGRQSANVRVSKDY